METKNVITTLFEFTSTGYENVKQQQDDALTRAATLRKEEQELNKLHGQSVGALNQLIAKWEQLNRTMDANTAKKVREEFAELPRLINDATAAKAKATAQLEAKAKAQDAENKKAKEAADIASTYKKVMDELSKGMANAEVSTSALTKAKKHLDTELAKTNVGTEKYKKLAEEQAKVVKASNDVKEAQRQQVKEMGVAEDSVAALRLKVVALKKEWLSMSQTDPGFAAKEAELKKYTDELVVAEEKVGIFSRSVGNYKSALDGIGGSLDAIIPGLGGVTKGIGAMTKQALAFIATPIGAIIAAITVALKAVHAAFTRSAEGQEKLNVVMGYFSGFVTVLLDLLADLGEWIIKVFTEPKAAFEDFKKYVLDPATIGIRTIANAAMGAGLAVAGIFSKKAREESKQYFNQIKQDWQDLADTAVGVYDAIKNKAGEVVDKAKEGARIAEMENQLKRDQLQYGQEIKENENKIADLRRQAADKEKLTAKQRAELLNQALELEKRNGEIRVSFAKQEYEIQAAKNAMGKTNLEDLQKEQDLKNGIVQAETDSLNKQRELVAQTAEIRKSASDKAKADQEKANADYIKALQDRMKAAEDVAKAEADGDGKALESYKKILTEREAELEKAKAKRLTLSQLERDELELQEYQHQKNLKAIQKEGTEKKADEYLKAVADVRTAQSALLEAEKRGNATEIALYKRMLNQKKAALSKFNSDQITLNDEQRLADEMASFDHQQKMIDDYIALQQTLAELQTQYTAAQTTVEREAIQKQIDLVKAKVAAQTQALQTLGVDISGINTNIKQSIDTTYQSMSERLEQSLQTIQQFSGQSQNTFFKLSTSITGLFTKAFDFKKATAGMDKTSKKFKELSKEFKEGMAEIGAAVAINGLDAITTSINASIEAEKAAIDEMYAYQEERAQEAYDRDSEKLKASLEKNEISRAKYALEQRKLDDKKAEEDKQREKEKALALYDLEVKQFRVNQAKDAISAVIATSLGVTKALPNLALAAIVGAMGAAQVGLIYAQKPPAKPKFERGGYLDFVDIDGPSHRDGGVPIRIGNREVAEAEGGEGALIISKKAMKNSYMRRLLRIVEEANADISGRQSNPTKFAEGGLLSYDDYLNEYKNGLRVEDITRDIKVGRQTITVKNPYYIKINGEQVFLRQWYKGRNNAIQTAVNEYVKSRIGKAYLDYLDKEEERITSGINERINESSVFQQSGIGSIGDYYNTVDERSEKLSEIDNEIKAYEELASARIEALKLQLGYEEKLAAFEAQRTDAANELSKTTQDFNTRVLRELLDAGQITEDEYLSMLDQITHGYGVKTKDIIDLKKKEVEAVKALINEERNAELAAVKETASYREEALEQMRAEWEENYDAVTQQIIEDVENASEAVSQLTGTDLERYNEILRIQQEIRKMEDDYARNETLLTDGIITNREERAAMVAEQKRIKEELARAEQEAEEAKAAFEAERQKNMESARAAYETENFADLLAQIKELGAGLQAEGNKWTLDKELAAELDAELQSINATYDEQIAKQDAIISGLQAEIDAAQLLHDKKVAYIKEEETALKESFATQQAEIEAWLAEATAGLRSEAAELSQFIAALKVAGLEAGLVEYEKGVDQIANAVETMPKKYATGGAIEIGSGLYQVAGPSHSQGGVPIRVGNTQIAEVEGIEKMFAVNKMAAHDPEMMAALARASDINARYTGVPLVDGESHDSFSIDYDLLAAKIGAQINSRPIKTVITHRDMQTAYDITQMHKRASFMK